MRNKFLFKRLSVASTLKPFDCGNPDLNDFFHNDSKDYVRHLLAVTYTLEDERQTAAFFSVLNDKIINKDPETEQTISNKLTRSIPNKKRRPSYPSVKIGRFAVGINYQNQGIGSEIIDFVKIFFTKANKTGCRFITVDAYREAIGFYEKNGFRFLTQEDKNDMTRLMYFDLITFIRNTKHSDF